MVNILGTVSGIARTVLGIFNTWRQADREKVKLALQWTNEPWGGALGPAVVVHSLKIANRSPFAVTIDDVGITFKEVNAPKVIFSQTVTNEDGDCITKSLPLRLDSHDSMTLTSDSDMPDSVFQRLNVKYVYVKTGDGTVTKLSSPN